jgi:hypothetical protein
MRIPNEELEAVRRAQRRVMGRWARVEDDPVVAALDAVARAACKARDLTTDRAAVDPRWSEVAAAAARAFEAAADAATNAFWVRDAELGTAEAMSQEDGEEHRAYLELQERVIGAFRRGLVDADVLEIVRRVLRGDGEE